MRLISKADRSIFSPYAFFDEAKTTTLFQDAFNLKSLKICSSSTDTIRSRRSNFHDWVADVSTGAVSCSADYNKILELGHISKTDSTSSTLLCVLASQIQSKSPDAPLIEADF